MYVVIAFTSNSYYAFQEMSRRQNLDHILIGNPKTIPDIILAIEEVEQQKISTYDREVIFRTLSSCSKYTKEGDLWSLKESVSYLKLIL